MIIEDESALSDEIVAKIEEYVPRAIKLSFCVGCGRQGVGERHFIRGSVCNNSKRVVTTYYADFSSSKEVEL